MDCEASSKVDWQLDRTDSFINSSSGWDAFVSVSPSENSGASLLVPSQCGFGNPPLPAANHGIGSSSHLRHHISSSLNQDGALYKSSCLGDGGFSSEMVETPGLSSQDVKIAEMGHFGSCGSAMNDDDIQNIHHNEQSLDECLVPGNGLKSNKRKFDSSSLNFSKTAGMVDQKDHLDDCSGVVNEPNSQKHEPDRYLGYGLGKKQLHRYDESSHPFDVANKRDYVHRRAKRGQATNSHSVAERLRREKINNRMKLLQDLVPGCNKITGKALLLDEIISYVRSLQKQVEFLAMKLATVNSELNSEEMEQVLSMDMSFFTAPYSLYPQDALPGPQPQLPNTTEQFFQASQDILNHKLHSVAEMGSYPDLPY